MGRIAPLGHKHISRSAAEDTSVLCYLRGNADRSPPPQTGAGADITAMTAEVTTNLVALTVNGSAETVIGTYTGNSGSDNQAVFGDTNCATIQQLLNVLNGVATGQSSVVRRWRAGLGDFRPQFVIGTGDGTVAAAANALLGRGEEGLALLADSSNLASASTIAVGLGIPFAKEGGGQSIPDHFETDFSSTVAGVRTPVRNSGRLTEDQPGRATFQVLVTDIQCGMAHATTKVVTAYDNLGNTLKAEAVTITAGGTIAGTGRWDADNPWVVGPPGSPVWIEVTGTGGLTDGTLTVSGFVRVA